MYRNGVRVWGFGVECHFQLYESRQFYYWWRKHEDPQKTTDLSQVTDRRYHIISRNERINICDIVPLQRTPIYSMLINIFISLIF